MAAIAALVNPDSTIECARACDQLIHVLDGYVHDSRAAYQEAQNFQVVSHRIVWLLRNLSTIFRDDEVMRKNRPLAISEIGNAIGQVYGAFDCFFKAHSSFNTRNSPSMSGQSVRFMMKELESANEKLLKLCRGLDHQQDFEERYGISQTGAVFSERPLSAKVRIQIDTDAAALASLLDRVRITRTSSHGSRPHSPPDRFMGNPSPRSEPSRRLPPPQQVRFDDRLSPPAPRGILRNAPRNPNDYTPEWECGRPLYASIHPNLLCTDILNFHGIPWKWSRHDDPPRVIILRELPKRAVEDLLLETREQGRTFPNSTPISELLVLWVHV